MPRAARMTMTARLLLTLCTPLLTLAALPGGPAPLLVFVSMVPWLLALEGATPVQGAAVGMAGGFAGWLMSVRWLPGSIGAYASLHPLTAWGSTLLFCLYAAVPYGAFGWLRRRFPGRGGVAASLEGGVLLALLVHLFPVPLPGTPAHSLYRAPELIQSAALGGVFLVLCLVFAVNCLLADFAASLVRRGPRPASLVCCAALVAVAWTGGWARLQLQDRGPDSGAPAVVVTAIQPDIPVSWADRAGTGRAGDGLATLMGMSREALAGRPDTGLLVWPEIPLHLPDGGPSPVFEAIAGLARELGVPILYQCTGAAAGNHGAIGYHNSMRLVTADGRAGPRYDKHVLVPFAEYLPLGDRFGWLRDLFPGVSGYVPGGGPRVIPVAGARVAPAICYEAVFPEFVREAAAEGGNVLVNAVDDAWFGDSPASSMHLALGLFRAVEFDMPVVRVANAGIGAHIRAGGRIEPGSETAMFTRAIRARRVQVSEGRSLYAVAGDWAVYAALAWLAAVAALRARRPA